LADLIKRLTACRYFPGLSFIMIYRARKKVAFSLITEQGWFVVFDTGRFSLGVVQSQWK
jgi:hypothetical protein